jgi:hypothetical protein
MDVASFNESALTGRDEVVDERREVSASTFVMIFTMLWMRLMGM